MRESYDAVVIGSGQGGGPLAQELAKKGKQTLLIEMQAVGGTCINRGCTPTKTLVASAKTAYEARRTAQFGVHATFQSVDMKAVRRRKQNIVDSFRDSSQKRMEKNPNLDLVFGHAHFLDDKTIEIKTPTETQKATFSIAFINSGCRPKIPKIEGLDSVPYLDSTSIMELEEVPEHLVAIGAGYISMEFGQMFRRFGSKVTLIEPSERLVKREDPDISEALKQVLSEDGIDIYFNAAVKKLSKSGKTIQITLETSGKITTLDASHLLIGAGRAPNTEELNLKGANIQADERGYIKTNDQLQTNIPHIYAIGDVKGGPAFTHISYDDYRIVRDNLFSNKKRTTKGRLVPYTVFIDPQLGSIGLNEEQAKKLKIPHKVAKMPMNYVARALETDNPRGLMKAIVHAETGEILGCTILGIEGGELMAMIEIAMLGKLPYTVLKEAVFAHPTLAESFNNLFGTIE